MNYGLPYMGSKSRIAKQITDLFPKAKNLYDLFCGGCAITDYCLRNNKFENYIINDVNPQCIHLFEDALQGKFKNETRWISREDFFRLKDTDDYISFCWSFGNNNRTYMYNPTIEKYKKACHYAIVFDDWKLLEELCPEVVDVAKKALNGLTDTHERRLAFGPSIVKELKRLNVWSIVENNPLYKSCHWRGGKLERLESLQSLERLERLQSLERLERLQSLERLEKIPLKSYNKSYDEITIEKDSVIYCDIPYKGTAKYKDVDSFDYEKFYDWCTKQTELVLVSEYNMPTDRFTCIKEIEKNCSLSPTTTNKTIEKVFVPTNQLELYKSMIDKKDNIFEM